MSGGSLVIGVPLGFKLPNQQLPGVFWPLMSAASPLVGLPKNPLCVNELCETLLPQSS